MTGRAAFDEDQRRQHEPDDRHQPAFMLASLVMPCSRSKNHRSPKPPAHAAAPAWASGDQLQPPHQQQDREDGEHDQRLPELDPDVEGGQRARRSMSPDQLSEPANPRPCSSPKPKTTEAGGDSRRRASLGRDVGDRQRDQRLDDLGRHVDPAERAERERDAVRGGERGRELDHAGRGCARRAAARPGTARGRVPSRMCSTPIATKRPRRRRAASRRRRRASRCPASNTKVPDGRRPGRSRRRWCGRRPRRRRRTRRSGSRRRPRASPGTRTSSRDARVVAPVARRGAGTLRRALALDPVEEDLDERQHVRLGRALPCGGVERRRLEAQLVAHRAPLAAHVRVARAAAHVRVARPRRDEEEHQRRHQRGPHGPHGIAARPASVDAR